MKGPSQNPLFLSLESRPESISSGILSKWFGKGDSRNSDFPVFQDTFQSFLNGIQSSLFLFDKNLFLIFMNDHAQDRLYRIEDTFVDRFGVQIDNMIGCRVNKFRFDRTIVEDILTDHEKHPYTGEYTLGKLTFRIMVQNVENSKGECLGYMVEAVDITGSTQTQKQLNNLNRVAQILDRFPENILFVDPASTIQYVNNASQENLERIASYLPAELSDLMGTPLRDWDPSIHWNRLFMDDGLPHNLKVNVGPETLELTAFPIMKDPQTTLGFLIYWDFISGRMLFEKRRMDSTFRILKTIKATREYIRSPSYLLKRLMGSLNNHHIIFDEAAPTLHSLETSVKTVHENINGVLYRYKNMDFPQEEAESIINNLIQDLEQCLCPLTIENRKIERLMEIVRESAENHEKINSTANALEESIEKMESVINEFDIEDIENLKGPKILFAGND